MESGGQKIVVDSSVFLAITLPDEKSDYADEIYDKIKTGAVWPAAQPLFYLESLNIIAAGVKRNRIQGEHIFIALKALEEWPAQDAQFSMDAVYQAEIFQLAQKHNLSVYDASYLALAARLNAPLATLDVKLEQAARAEQLFYAG